MRHLVEVNGIPIPEPSEYTGNTATIVDSARNTEGYMVGAVIRDDVGKVECVWKYITAEDWANLLAMFSISKGGHFINPVTFYCQDSNSWETRNMYISDRNANVFKRNKDGSIAGWLNARIAFIEV